MRNKQPVLNTLKLLSTAVSAVIVLLLVLTFSKNNEIFRKSELAVQLSQIQEKSHYLQNDLESFQGYLISQNYNKVNGYLADKTDLHKQWLKVLIKGLDEEDQLVVFSKKYLLLLKQLRGSNLSLNFGTRRQMLELIESISKDDFNIITLSQQRMWDNFNGLNNNIIFVQVISIILILFFIILVFINYQQFKKLIRASIRSERLSLFFINHPDIILRLAPSGRIRYYNKQASRFMEKYSIDKYKILPPEVSSKLSQVINAPDRDFCFTNQVKGHLLDCHFRLCKESGQIFVTIIESATQPDHQEEQVAESSVVQ